VKQNEQSFSNLCKNIAENLQGKEREWGRKKKKTRRKTKWSKLPK
jgi:hypothetical protein